MIDSRVAGLDVRTTQRETSIALGYAATTTMAQIPSNDSVIMAVDYSPDRPELTRLVFRKWGKMRSLAWIAGLPALALLWGCEPTQLYVGATTVVGLNAAMNTEQTAGHLKIGYDRTFVTVVPKSVPVPEGGREAMAVLSCSDLEVTGIFITGFREYLATGKAAMNYGGPVQPASGQPGDRRRSCQQRTASGRRGAARYGWRCSCRHC